MKDDMKEFMERKSLKIATIIGGVIIVILIVFTLLARGGKESYEADKRLISQKLLFETLVNERCEVSGESPGLYSIKLPSGEGEISVKVFPGVQNQEKASNHIAETTKTNYNATIAFMEEPEIAGGKGAGFTAEWKDEETQYTRESWCLFENQSLYHIYSTYQNTISEEEKELMSEVIENIRILSPEMVDGENKTATYKENFPDAEVFAGSEFQEKANALKELPYVYYGGWWNKEIFADEGWDVYESENSMPSFYLYANTSMYWNWGWDTSIEWDFYVNYGEYYQIYAFNEDAAKEKAAKEQEAADKVAVVWDFKAGKIKDGATRQQYQDALTVVDALAYEGKKQELKGVLGSVNETLAAREKEEAEKKAAAEKAAAQAAQAAQNPGTANQGEGRGDLIEDDWDDWDYDPYSDPGDYYDPYSDPGDYGDYYW